MNVKIFAQCILFQGDGKKLCWRTKSGLKLVLKNIRYQMTSGRKSDYFSNIFLDIGNFRNYPYKRRYSYLYLRLVYVINEMRMK